MAYHAVTALGQAFDLLDAGARPIAGGTDWFPAQGERSCDVTLLDVNHLPGFRGISRDAAGWRIGAATRWSDVLRADLPAAFDGLRAAAREVGSVQIQNVGTVAGNLCNASPAADGVPPLLVLNASVEMVSRRGLRVLPLTAFLTGVRQVALQPGELVAAILIPDLIPDLGTDWKSGFAKAGSRRYLVISTAMVAVLLRLKAGRIAEARVAVGACSPVAQRLAGYEAALRGRSLQDLPQLAAPDLAGLSPISDIRASAGYRIEILSEMIARLLRQTGRQDG